MGELRHGRPKLFLSCVPTRLRRHRLPKQQGRGAITLEKIALLRVRLKKDNSELIEFAIEELFRKHNAKWCIREVN